MLIYICDHQVPTRVADTPLVRTIVSGIAPGPGERFHTDLVGPNMAADKRLSEVRLHWFVWKNFPPGHDSVGFEHYRRALLLPLRLTADEEARYPLLRPMYDQVANWNTRVFHASDAVFAQYHACREQLTAAQRAVLTHDLAPYDMVVPGPEYVSLRRHFEGIFEPVMPGSWQKLVEAAAGTTLGRSIPQARGCDPHLCYWCNMYVLRRPIFEEYMTFAFAALEAFEAAVDHPLMREPRYRGHIAERLFTLYVWLKRAENPAIRVLEVALLRHAPEMHPDQSVISHDLRWDLDQQYQRGLAAAASNAVS